MKEKDLTKDLKQIRKSLQSLEKGMYILLSLLDSGEETSGEKEMDQLELERPDFDNDLKFRSYLE